MYVFKRPAQHQQYRVRMLKRCIEEISADQFVCQRMAGCLEYLADTKTEETNPNDSEIAVYRSAMELPLGGILTQNQ